MWAFSSSQVTVYTIQPGRGFEQAATVLGVGFEGFLVRDGWIVYRGVLPGHAPNLLGPSSAALPERRSWWPEREPASFPAACKKFCSEHSNYASGAIKARSASVEWRWPEDDWKRNSIERCNVAFARLRTDGWPSICYGSEMPCLLF